MNDEDVLKVLNENYSVSYEVFEDLIFLKENFEIKAFWCNLVKATENEDKRAMFS